MKTSDLRLVLRLSALTALVTLAAGGEAEANPKGGQVVAGSATIAAPSSNQLSITQSTDRAAINWMSFNIAPNERTNFQQPSSSSMTLNRVQAGDPSLIAGRLTANGQIVLINPSGIVFAKGSQVDVNSLIATPSDISNANFMAGRMKFDRPSSDPRASVVNHGTITVAQKGFAALVAPGVANSGVIQAKLGKVVLAGAETYTVDFYGDGLINFDVGSKVATAPRGLDGKPVKSLVSNSGEIDAPGGRVLLTAAAAAGIVENVVDVPGRIVASASGRTAGKVTIDAGAGNAARLAGNIDVSGLSPGQMGGTATVTGGSVALVGTARIDARGNAGGGTIKIGGGPHGKDPKVRNARTTTIAAGTVIDASATGKGSGGQVAVWSDQATEFAGAILARGGAIGGDGGWVETSGHSVDVANSAIVHAGAVKGKRGLWLLDPADVTISTAATSGGSFNGGTPDTFNPDPAASAATVNAGTIETTLNGGADVAITTTSTGTGAGNITVNAPITWTTPTILALEADGSIAINAPVTGTNAFSDFILGAGGGVSQSLAGTIATGILQVTALGPVSLPSANAIGTLAFHVTGAGNEFLFRNNQRNLTIGFGDGTSVETNGGPLTVVTTGTSTAGFNLTIPGGETVSSAGGAMTLMAGGLGGTFTNSGIIDSTVVSPVAAAGNVVILADTMSLGAGSINAKTGGAAGTVVLGPATATTPIALGTPAPAGSLNLLQADLDSISAGMLQVGYRNIDGTPSLAGDINIASPIIVDTTKVPDLLLVTGGGISQSSGATITALVPVSPPAPPPLSLGLFAGGPVALGEANRVATVAGFVDGAANGFLYRNDAAALAIGALASPTIGVAFDASGIPSAGTMTGPAANPLAGVATVGGTLTVAATGVPTVGFDNLSVLDPVSSQGGKITLMAGGSGGTFSNFSTIDSTSASPAGAGDIVILADFMTLGTGTINALTAGAAGTVVLGPVTATDDIVFTTPSPGIGLALLQSDLDSISAGMLQVGYRNIDGTPSLTGNITIATPLTIDTTKIPSLLLVTGGGITETPGSFINSPALALGIIAGGPVSMGEANQVGTLAGFVDGATNSFLFRNDSAALAIGAVPLPTLGVAFDASGIPSSANMGGPATNPLSGVATANGNILLETTTAGNLVLSQTVNAGTGLVALGSAGSLTQAPPIIASALAIASADRVSLGAFVGPTEQGDANRVGTLAGQVLNAGQSFVFRNDAASLTIGTVDVSDSFGNRLAALPGPLSGVVTNNANIGLRVTTSGDLLLTQNVNAGTAGVGLEAAGQVQQSGGIVSGGALQVSAAGPVTLAGANVLGVLAGQVTGAGNGLSLRDQATGLTVGTVGPLVEQGTGTPPTNQMLSVGALSGVVTNNGNILLETTGSGNLALDQTVNAGTGVVGLGSAGTLTQAPPIIASALAVVSADRVSLGAFVGPTEHGDANRVGTLAGEVRNAGQSFVFRNDQTSLTIGTVALDVFDAPFLDPVSPSAPPLTSLSGVVTNNANIGLRVTTSGDLLLTQNVTAGSGALGFESAGQVLQTGGVVTGSALEVSAVGAVSLSEANAVGVLAGQATGAGNSLLYRNDNLGLTIDTVATLLEQGTGTPPNNQMLSVGAQSGVTSNGGNILLETTTAGNLVLSQTVNAGTGSVALGSAGTLTQAPPIIASALAIVSADRVSLGAFGGPSDPNQVGILAGRVLNPGESFVFRNDAASLTIGTVDVSDSFGARLAALPGPLSGVVTNNANIGLRVTTSGDLLLTQNVTAGTAGVGLESAGQVQQSGGVVTASTLEVSAVGAVSLPDANVVPVLAGQTTGAGNSLLYRNDNLGLTIDTVATLLEQGTGTPPSNQMLSVGALSGVTSNGGNILLETTTAGNLVLSQTVNAGIGSVALGSAGMITQAPAGVLSGSGLEVLAANSVALGSANTVSTVSGAVVNAGQTFLLRDDNRSLTVGTIDVVDGFGTRMVDQRVVPQTVPPTLLAGALSGVATANGNILLETTTAGNLVLSRTVDAGTGLVALGSAGSLTQAPPIIASALAIASADRVSLGAFVGPTEQGDANRVGTLAGQVVNAGQSFVFRNDAASLTIGTVDVSDSFGNRLAALPGPLSGVVTNNANIGLRVTTSGDLLLTQDVNAGTAGVGLEAAGQVQQSGGIVSGGALQVSAAGPVTLAGANVLGVLAGQVTGAGTGLSLRDQATGLTVGTVGPLVEQGTGAPPTNQMLSVGALSGVVTNNGNILLETTGSGNLALDQTVNAGTGVVGLGSAGTLTQAPPIIASALAIVSADRVSLGAFVGPTEHGDANRVGTLAGEVRNAGQSFVFRNDQTSLTIGTVALDVFDAPFLDPVSPSAPPLTSLSGVVTNNANIGLRVTTSGDLLLTQNVTAGSGALGFESAGQVRQTGGVVTGSALEVSAVGAVSLSEANAVGVLAGQATGAGNSLLYRNDNLGLTVDTVATLLEQGTGTPPNNQMLSVGALSGVTSNGGNILLETTTAGNLVLSQTVNAGIGSVALGSAGTLTQAPPIIASALAIVSADRVSLGAFGGPSDPNQVGILAGQVLNAGQSFVFRNDAASLTIGTVDVSDSFGARLAALPGPLSGVVTNNANIGLRVTTSGDLLLTQNVAAGTGGVGFESAGQVQQSGGVVTASTLEVSAVGAVSLPDANAVGVLAGQVSGTGNGFLFRDDSTTLTIATVGPLLEQGTGTPPNNQMLSVGALSGVTSNGGNLALETTTAGNLVLASNVDTAGGLAALIAAGNAMEAGGNVAAAGLIADAGAGIVFNSGANAVGTLAGVAANGAFQFTNAAALTVGTVGPVADVGAQSGIRAASSTAGDVLIQTNGPGQPLTLAGDITAGGRAIFDTAGAFVQVGTVTVSAPVFAVDTTGAGIAKLLSFVSATSNADAVANLAPTGTTRNPIQFDNLVAPGSVALLFADGGVVNGIMQVSQLGLSGTGASAALFGSINGDATGTAAAQGVRNPGPESTYLFNNCIIAGTSCVLLPAAALVPPQMVSDINLALLIPFQPFSTLDFATSDALRPRREENPDLPVINIFDEERLCGVLPGSGEATREPCR